MKLALLLLASTTVARADVVLGAEAGQRWKPEHTTDVWLDFAIGTQRTEPGDGIRYSGQLVRFAPTVALGRFLYLGAAFSVTEISGSSGMTDDPYAISTGTILAPQVLIGARAAAGIFTAAVELAPTLRYTNGNFTGQGLSVPVEQRVVELHGRLDAWVTPHATVGLFAGIGHEFGDDLQAALQIGFHVFAYDRRR